MKSCAFLERGSPWTNPMQGPGTGHFHVYPLLTHFGEIHIQRIESSELNLIKNDCVLSFSRKAILTANMTVWKITLDVTIQSGVIGLAPRPCWFLERLSTRGLLGRYQPKEKVEWEDSTQRNSKPIATIEKAITQGLRFLVGRRNHLTPHSANDNRYQ